MPRDHIIDDFRAAEALADTANDDGYGIGFTEYQIRTSYRDLCRMIGTQNARATVNEIMDAEPRKRITIDG
ncbi:MULTISPECIES: hypothetical protein [unclassified Mesorhizobium]|uniref:hypothetical protein n=1 Tax=unclassified Mesorhizobium TaxID=325217 RepID=UPI000FC9CBCC|nr:MULTISPECIES: hypothetical protein [unclassified Mesorhizobium]TGP29080.1 hypothetical protein EN875_030165 [Mesorhizobium sp. M2D.F.Ca.ET.232.01.1.1]TGQ24602.1 hypothetical protein EN863_061320 [Mesorhizobium sp. M00.F.Ca.ET.220.01.1.1]TGU12199.1 hypothetical protein EN806_17380 [bacterium M00.F.Ca.ET.163.01.1.1]